MSEISHIIAALRQLHRQRCFAMEQRKRADLATASYLRIQLGWRRDLPKPERDKINEQALALLDLGSSENKLAAGQREAVEKGRQPPAPFSIDEPAYHEHRDVILASVQAREPFKSVEAQATKAMVKLAVQMPVWSSFGEPINGFGPLGLAIIIGEAGDLADYPTHSKLWKRMGLAFMDEDGVRQGGLPKNAAKQAWVRHGYSRVRRSRMWTIGSSLTKKAGPYRDIYLARKEAELRKAAAEGLTVAPSAKIPEKRAHEFRSAGHVDRRAQRYMEKRLLRDLWKAWRRAIIHVPTQAILSVPASGSQRTQEVVARRAVEALESREASPS